MYWQFGFTGESGINAVGKRFYDREQERLNITALILPRHADFAFLQFTRYPVNASVETQQQKQENLARLRKNSPGSIVPQTLRLGRVIIDMLEHLRVSNTTPLSHSPKKQTELLCPQNDFFDFLLPLVNNQHHEWQETLNGKSIDYAINQLAIQIAWLIGCFSHLDNNPPDTGRYLEYGLPCITLYREHPNEFLNTLRAIGQAPTSTQGDHKDQSSVDADIVSLLHEVHVLSSKTHADLPPAITPFQKETAIVQAGIEKLLIELMAEGMGVKMVVMSVFYFWFTLDAPLCVEDPTVFDEMDNIIDLVKTPVRALPEPTLSAELQLLNAKMQALKSNLPDLAPLDEGDQNSVAHQRNTVNTAIHTLTSDYLKQDYHVEVIANVLFSQWLRLSVFLWCFRKRLATDGLSLG